MVVRCRPLNSKEVAEGRQRIVDVDTALSQVDHLLKLQGSGYPALVDEVHGIKLSFAT